ncbi:MAG: hypothetical protein RLZZ543_278 [Bacteroidota bacterium]|jgi:hypothetical protein
MHQQGVFFTGGMNTDDEDRLIPNGEVPPESYRETQFPQRSSHNAVPTT